MILNKPTWTDLWYDWNIRQWCLQVKTDSGEQYDMCSEYFVSKANAEEYDKFWCDLYNIDLKYSRKKRREYKDSLEE